MPQLMVTLYHSHLPFAARDMLKIMMPELDDNKKFNAYMRRERNLLRLCRRCTKTP